MDSTGRSLATRPPYRHGRWSRRLLIGMGVAALTLALAAPMADAASAKVKRVSVKTGGSEADGASSRPEISSSGRFVAFESVASDLVVNDTNGKSDIFVHDRKKNKTKRISVTTGGGEANGPSFEVAISSDGRFVAFHSFASNLVPGDTNAVADIFVHDRMKRKTRRVSVSGGGTEGDDDSTTAAISATGRFVVFESKSTNLVSGDNNNKEDVFIHDRWKRKTKRVSVRSGGTEGNGNSFHPSVSPDGRHVAFSSASTNLVGSDTNAATDIFVRDRAKGKTKRVSIRGKGIEAKGGSTTPSISASGRFVTFRSNAGNLVAGDTNGEFDIFVRDRAKKKTRRVSVRGNGSEPNEESTWPKITPNGRYVIFESRASNLVAKDTNGRADVFLHDRSTKKTRRVSQKRGGGQAGGYSGAPSLTADGRLVAFESSASDIIGSDTNGASDIFVRGPLR